MGQYDGLAFVEEIEQPIINVSKPPPELIYAVSKIVRLGPAQFVAELGEPLDAHDTLGISFLRQAFQPCEGRAALPIAIEDDRYRRHKL